MAVRGSKRLKTDRLLSDVLFLGNDGDASARVMPCLSVPGANFLSLDVAQIPGASLEPNFAIRR